MFGQGTRTPVAITLLVKDPNAAVQGRILFHDIGDYLTREEKLATVARFGSVEGIERAGGWRKITPDAHGDWLDQRDNSFASLMAMGDKSGKGSPLFAHYSNGLKSQRDAWAYNPSRDAVAANMKTMIDVYSSDLARLNIVQPVENIKAREVALESIITTDAHKISWTHALKQDLIKGRELVFDESCLTPSMYRPFTRQWLYYNRSLNERVFQMPRIFPMEDATAENRVICVSAGGVKLPFSALMTDVLPSLHMVDIEGTQCFPRWVYVPEPLEADGGLLQLANAAAPNGTHRRDAITGEGLALFKAAYPGETIEPDDIFHYVYGLLHSEEYRSRYADNLSKELPRIPVVRGVENFRAFVHAGKKLGDLHCGYENVEPHPVRFLRGDTTLVPPQDPERFFRVEQMKFAGKRPNIDKSTVIYNSNITITGIPLEAYDYIVNGRSALEWVMERQVVKTDKDSGIVNDANRYATETMGDPAYPLKLFQRVVTVSLETLKIVRSLPPLDIVEPEGAAKETHPLEPVQ